MDLRQTPSPFVIATFPSFVFPLLLVYGSTKSHRDSLLAFKSKIFNDPLGIFNSWNESVDFCSWLGAICGRRHRRVTTLDLRFQQLEGSLLQLIGNLSFLRALNLQNNSLILGIPQELGALFRLRILDLENNLFSGAIPANLSRCSNLESLILSGNDLGGELPSELGVLSKLQDISLRERSHHLLAIFHRLRLLSYQAATFGQLRNLTRLIIADNELSSSIPTSIFNPSSLTLLWFTGNKLNGSLPIDIGLTLPKLEILVFNTNQISGHIPKTIANLTSLAAFDIGNGNNGFTEKVPYLGSLHDLRRLTLAHNDLGKEKMMT